MAKKQLIVEFKPKGDKTLTRAIRTLDIVTNRLQKTTSIYEKELKNMGLTSKQVTMFLAKQNRTSLLGVKNNRLLGNSFATLRSKMLLVSFGLGLVTMGFRKLFEAAIKQEQAEKKLSVALGKTNTALLQQASALQKVTAFGDEAVIEVQALIGAFTQDEEQIKSLTVATLDLAQAKGMDLTSAADLVSKTFGSTTNSLSRYGIQVKGASGSTERLNSLTENIAELFGGQATASAETLGGAVTQMTNAIGDANEALGGVFEPLLRKIVKNMKDGAESARDFFLALKEDDLGTLVRHFEELGVSSDALANIKEFQLNTEIEELNKKLEKTGTKFKSSKEVLEAIDRSTKNLASPVGMVNSQLEGQVRNQQFLNGLIRAQEKIQKNNLEVNGKKIKILDDEGNLLKKIRRDNVDDLITTYEHLVADNMKNKSMQHTIRNSETIVAKTFAQQEALMQVLKILLEIESKQQQLVGGLPEEKEGFFKRIFGDEEQMKEIMGHFDTLQSKITEFAESEIQSEKDYANARIKIIDDQEKAELDALKNTWLYKKMTDAQKADEERKVTDKFITQRKRLRDEANADIKRAFKATQALKIAQAIMNTAELVTQNLHKPWKAAFIATMGAIEVATIKSQKPPVMQYGGMVGGKLHSQGGTLIEAERGEFVMSRNATEAIGVETLNRLNSGLGNSVGSTIVINNPVLGKDMIEDEIVPQIQEALRRGGDIDL